MADHALHFESAGSRRAAPTRIVGGYLAIARISAKLSQRQFVTIVGPGGIGKSAMARAFASDMRAGYPDGVFLVNVGLLTSADMLAAAILSVLGAPPDQADPWLAISRHLTGKQVLVILDGCEHLLLATAAAAEQLRASSDVASILATSREALRADGEWVYRLPALTTPGSQTVSSREEAETFTAVQLFVDRAAYADPDFQFTDDKAQVVCDICRCLDGIPLALELAAARASQLGLEGLAAQINDRLGWRADDAHSAEPRHRTLCDTLDWSHDLLSDVERVVLRRVSVFRSVFDIQAASAIAGDEELSAGDVVDGLAGLLAKSLLTSTDASEDGRYRLLDTTREYAFRKLLVSGDGEAASRRHVQFMRGILAEADTGWETLAPAAWAGSHLLWLDDVRSALDWSLAAGDDPTTIVALAVGGFHLTRQLGAESDFKPRIKSALSLLCSLATRQPLLELQLNRCISAISHLPRAKEEAQIDALHRALQGEEQQTSESHSATVASGIAMMVGMFGSAGFLADYPRMNEWFNRIDELARRSGDPMALLTADRVRAQTLHWGGAHAMAGRVARRILDGNCLRIPFAYNPSPIDLRVSMRIVLARSLWMQGSARRAAQVIAEGMRCALEDSPLSQCQIVAYGALPIALWGGDDTRVDELVALLNERADRCSIGDWKLWAREFGAVAAERRGRSPDPNAAVPFSEIRDAQLVDHLCTLRPERIAEPHVERVLAGQASWCAPEILRAHAVNQLASEPDQRTRDSAEALLRQSLGLANVQGALAWELRSTASLCRLLQSTGRTAEARSLLSAILKRCKDCVETRDFVDAQGLLADLESFQTARQRA